MANDMRRYYSLFVKCYRGRSDVVARQESDGSFKPVHGGFTYERFLEQLDQTNIYGVYNLDDEGNVGFVMYDMDIFPRVREPWDQMAPMLRAKKEQVRALIAALGNMGVGPDQVLMEFPTVGYHIVLPFAAPLPVRQAKAFARLARDRAGLQYEMPFYPEETSGHGDMVRLPLRLNSATGHRSNFVRDIASFDPATYDETPDFAPLERSRPIDATIVSQTLDKAYSKLYRRVARAQDVPPGAARLVSYEGERVLLVNDNGKVYAVTETCRHADGPLATGTFKDGVITCPWHGAQFRVATGEALSGPARMGLVHHALRVENGEIWVGPAQP